MADRPRRQGAAPPDPGQPAQPPPRQPPAAQQPPPPYVPPQHPLFVRAPPQFKSGSDLDLYLQRFGAYARAANCPPGEQGDLLLSLLDDKALDGVSRTIGIGRGDVELDDVIAQLRRAEGYHANSEKYVTELRNRKRLRNESIWNYHIDLHKLAQKAYPTDEAMRQGSLRESFIANINDSYLASRLRELQQLDMEELLDTAIMLQGCQAASAKPVHSVDTVPDNSDVLGSELLSKLNNVTQHLQDLTVTMKPIPNATPAWNPQPDQPEPNAAFLGNVQQPYRYEGPRHSFGQNPPNQQSYGYNKPFQRPTRASMEPYYRDDPWPRPYYQNQRHPNNRDTYFNGPRNHPPQRNGSRDRPFYYERWPDNRNRNQQHHPGRNYNSQYRQNNRRNDHDHNHRPNRHRSDSYQPRHYLPPRNNSQADLVEQIVKGIRAINTNPTERETEPRAPANSPAPLN